MFKLFTINYLIHFVDGTTTEAQAKKISETFDEAWQFIKDNRNDGYDFTLVDASYRYVD